eukprot:8997372-Pyramimonas_sp.AAC.1
MSFCKYTTQSASQDLSSDLSGAPVGADVERDLLASDGNRLELAPGPTGESEAASESCGSRRNHSRPSE